MENREIKFRAWNKEEKRMVYFDANLYEFGKFLVTLEDSLDTFQNWVFQQYTGLKGKNGKEIYEGDIVRAFHKGQYNQIGEVFFEKKRPSFRVRFKNNKDILVRRDLEVIGNIFENPELLK